MRVLLSWAPPAMVLTCLIGCRQPPAVVPEESRPFVFRSLNLNQRRPDGTKDWDLTSPEARYDLTSRTVRALGPSGILYKNNKPAYRISADLATVLNDGDLVVLEGQVRLQQLDKRKLLISGDRLQWRPSRSRMLIDQRPKAEDAESRLTVREIVFQQDRETLRFKGPTTLQRWERERSDENPPQTVVTTAEGTWNLRDGTLVAAGPVRAEQSKGRTLTAARLVGNTQDQYIDLFAPVTLSIPKSKGEVKAGVTRWNYQSNQLKSGEPFQAVLDKGSASGNGFVVDERSNTVIIPANCRLQQPEQRLRARRCSWNWRTDAVIADGGVELKRDSLNQITTAERLEGQLGDDGFVRFGRDGERVKSTIRLDQDSNSTSDDQKRSSDSSTPAVTF